MLVLYLDALNGNAYVDIASVLVADTLITASVSITALDTLAPEDTSGAARMGGVGVGDGVGLPDIHLGAAGSVLARSSVLVVVGGVPAVGVGLTIDPLNVVRALSIAVSYPN